MLVLVAALNVDAESLPYYTPPADSLLPSWSYYRTGASSIVRESGERVLLEDDEVSARNLKTATSLIVLINSSHHAIWDAIRRLVEQKFGIKEQYDNGAGAIPGPITSRPPYIGTEALAGTPWPEIGSGLEYFGVDPSLPKPQEYELRSGFYNQIESIQGFSELRLRVVDGTSLFGKEGTILELRRRDYCREWALGGRSVHIAIPLPYKEKRAFTVITDTEVKLIEALKSVIPGLTIRYFASGRVNIDFSKIKDAAREMAKDRQLEKSETAP
jgi:hypothetical protein